jgi:hypothetical protein
MTVGQVRSAQILLNKVLPDMRAIEHTGEVTTAWKLSL